jgi:methyl-accepting chemotaxis protein
LPAQHSASVLVSKGEGSPATFSPRRARAALNLILAALGIAQIGLAALIWVWSSGELASTAACAVAVAAATLGLLALASRVRDPEVPTAPIAEVVIETPAIPERADDPLDPLVRAFEAELAQLAGKLQDAAAGLLGNTDRLGAAAAKATAQVITVSIASEDTARRTESVTRAVEGLSYAIDEVGSKSAYSSQLAAALAAEAAQARATVAELAQVTGKIDKITEVIAGVAKQTNLLALNATIEAARSGAAGRGFAVVAQEVKALAGQTAEATQDIGSQVAAMQSVASRSVAAIESVATRIHELDKVVAAINGSVEEQAATTKTIAEDIACAAMGVGQVEQSMVQIDGLADINTRAVADLSLNAQRFADHAREINARVRGFAQDVARLRA